jgi:diaminohydroxyphosphoribosylaminopyrimidine deaminase/5-amino-6-(5-phosphoribosylamino)uracil reductase
MVGIGTVLSDNPTLNVRVRTRRRVIQPIRVIVDGFLHTPLRANCLDRKIGGATIIATTKTAPEKRIEQMRALGVTVFVLPGQKGIVDLGALARALHAHGIQSVMVEGGQQLLSSMFRADLIDNVVAFFAPKVVGSEARRDVLSGWGAHFMNEAFLLDDVVIRRFGADVCVEGYVRHVSENAKRNKRNETKAR